MARHWYEFDGAAMALAGPYDLAVQKESTGFRWWIWSANSFIRIKQGKAETKAEAKGAAETAYADFMAFVARIPPLDVAAILAGQADE